MALRPEAWPVTFSSCRPRCSGSSTVSVASSMTRCTVGAEAGKHSFGRAFQTNLLLQKRAVVWSCDRLWQRATGRGRSRGCRWPRWAQRGDHTVGARANGPTWALVTFGPREVVQDALQGLFCFLVCDFLSERGRQLVALTMRWPLFLRQTAGVNRILVLPACQPGAGSRE